MHIRVQGTIIDVNSAYTTGTGMVGSFDITNWAPISYDVVVDAKEIMLLKTPIENKILTEYYYGADIRGKHIQLTQEVYEKIMGQLDKMNCEEAALMNEVALEKACKKGIKELEDVKGLWSKEEVNGLLGMKIDE